MEGTDSLVQDFPSASKLIILLIKTNLIQYGEKKSSNNINKNHWSS